MIILKIALCVLVAGILGFLGLFLYCMLVDWKHTRKDEGESEI